jgi:hypothetical protein
MKRQVEIFYGDNTNATVLVVISDSTSNNHVVVEMKSSHYYKTGNVLAETCLLPEKYLKEYLKDSFHSLGKEDLKDVKDDYPGILDSITTKQLQKIVLSLPEVRTALLEFSAVAKIIFDKHKRCFEELNK